MYGTYQNAYKKASVNTVDRQKLVVMLYDGAIKNVSMAIDRVNDGNIEQAHLGFMKSKHIITELMVSLNTENGGEIAKNLKSLYSYMYNQLIEANVNKKSDPAVVVLDLLKDLREAWAVVGKTPSQQQHMNQPSPNGNGQPPQGMKSINLKG